MTKILVNLVNQKGAGPKNISRQFINYAVDKGKYVFILNKSQIYEFGPDKNFICYKEYNSHLYRLVYFLYFYYYFIPKFIRSNGFNKYLVFGNYLFGILPCRKRLLIHHPYLFDFKGTLFVAGKSKIIEIIRYFIFRVLLVGRSNLELIIQSPSMYKIIKSSWIGCYPVKIIPNPKSSTLTKFLGKNQQVSLSQPPKPKKSILKLAYISRFYPHKRFDLLLVFIYEMRKYEKSFEVYITVSKETADLFCDLDDYPEINCLGEISHEELYNIYETIDASLYFSDRETFGNTILESLMFGKPIFGLRHSYFTDFIIDSESEMICECPRKMAEKIFEVFTNKDKLNQLKKNSTDFAKRFDEVPTWVAKMSEF